MSGFVDGRGGDAQKMFTPSNHKQKVAVLRRWWKWRWKWELLQLNILSFILSWMLLVLGCVWLKIDHIYRHTYILPPSHVTWVTSFSHSFSKYNTSSVPLKMKGFPFLIVPLKMKCFLKWKQLYLYFFISLTLLSLH